MAEIQFLGAARTVTGSKYLLCTGDSKIMIDCGLFQGLKELRKLNWQPLPVDINQLTAVILTHAHVDHTGSLPRVVRQGYKGPVYATTSTADLCRILMPDSGRLQEEDARYANKHGFSRHRPAKPLYTERDARATLELLHPIHYEETIALAKGCQFKFMSAGHILGSSFVYFDLVEEGKKISVLFSGDLGRYNVPILNDPTPVPEADYIVVESTYGNKLHQEVNVKEQLADVVSRTIARGGNIIIPAFAVGRTQEILYYLRELEAEKRIPIIPVMIDSPMAKYATQKYMSGQDDHDLDMQRLVAQHINPFVTHNFIMNGKSGASSSIKPPMVIISASGMATGGRVLHHLKNWLPDERSTVLFVGYQSEGTRGRRLQDGEKEVKIHGEIIPVCAEIATISGLSAHADYQEILRWLSDFKRPPKKVFITHGEVKAAEALRAKIIEKFGWEVVIPDYLQRVRVD